MDKATEKISGNFYNVYDLINSCFNPDVDQVRKLNFLTSKGRSIVEAVLNTMSVIFGLLITVIGRNFVMDNM